MPKRRHTSLLSPDRAAQAVSILIHEGKLRLLDLTRALERREEMVRELRAKLAAFGEGSGNGRRGGKRLKTKVRKSTKRISKAQRTARQAQGRYLGAIRRLSKANRSKVKAIREKSGVRTAISAAKKMASRKPAGNRRARLITGRKMRPAKSRRKKVRKSQRRPTSRKEAQPPAPTTP